MPSVCRSVATAASTSAAAGPPSLRAAAAPAREGCCCARASRRDHARAFAAAFMASSGQPPCCIPVRSLKKHKPVPLCGFGTRSASHACLDAWQLLPKDNLRFCTNTLSTHTIITSPPHTLTSADSAADASPDSNATATACRAAPPWGACPSPPKHRSRCTLCGMSSAA